MINILLIVTPKPYYKRQAFLVWIASDQKTNSFADQITSNMTKRRWFFIIIVSIESFFDGLMTLLLILLIGLSHYKMVHIVEFLATFD